MTDVFLSYRSAYQVHALGLGAPFALECMFPSHCIVRGPKYGV